MSWRELTTPGAEMVPMRENDFSLESSFHIRMSPSQDPAEREHYTSICGQGVHGGK